MRFDGQWLACDDGIVRPVIRAEIPGRDNIWRRLEFLVDTGADRTVISAGVLQWLSLETSASSDRIGGVGGIVDSATVRTQIRLKRDDGGKVIFRGEYAACTDHQALDMSVLGLRRHPLSVLPRAFDLAATGAAFLHVTNPRLPQHKPQRITGGTALAA